MKVEKDAVAVREPGRVPGSLGEFLLLQDMNDARAESLGPVVEVLLVPELPVLVAREAPLDASVLPPTTDRLAACARERGELHAVPSRRGGLIVFGGIAVARDEDLRLRAV